ncbi:Proteinase inhibitor I2, Kunitz metazoa domain and EB domain and Cysteine-rich repeat-containing protein [Strongyloides ratti]|uniref:Proteinase inhibitor I2, Kunitz metazoa domain and EB domain and Cysteine-rich repeat-containing protein n=1 Tax=Strongyloides ratti TaxID=34506 RepID=A0A090LCA6_STRRB|nr:Proteinase inhibitor I2, Kunitz metazoa domain and EB domain and Cysteine-rich repeat-containing protein [Strongyloides ratti]CEF65723.1 Proteinase inhibitor I2, Kunitz metazoa domain and EB domain and Cysteine-rich repeat-containing protein [Strongyloides ratti]
MLLFFLILLIIVKISIQKVNDKECVVHEDCPSNGAYCNEGYCKCLKTYVEIDNHCWKSLNPEEYGCFYNEQCNSAWPNATCTLSKCSCPDGEISTKTRYGYVCHKKMHCPFNGDMDILYEGGINIPSKCKIISLPYNKLLQNKFSQFINESKLQYLGCDTNQKMYDCIDEKCCPSPELTCTQPLDYGFSDNSPPVERYYYHKITGSCQKFYFKGNGGNSNNFINKLTCEIYCKNIAVKSISLKIGSNFLFKEKKLITKELLCMDRRELYEFQLNYKEMTLYSHDCEEFCFPLLCPNGKPLRIDGVGNIKCSTNKNCPDSYFCYDKLCCPTPTAICNQKKIEGSKCLINSIKRYFYNIDSESCEAFLYNGCHKNDNNFENIEDCIKTCENVEKVRICPYGKPYQSREGVPLKCKIKSSYNHNTNDQKKNISSINYIAKKVEYNKLNTIMNLSCPKDYYCHNDFNLSEYQICCPTPTFTCKLPIDEGIFCLPTPIIKYFYNFELKQCLPFLFRGCGGNSNRFNTKYECYDYCEKNNFIDKDFSRVYKDTTISNIRRKKISKKSKLPTFEEKIYKLFFKKYSSLINFSN